MAKSVKAIIDPRLLVWARKTAHLSLSDAAKKAKVAEATLEGWENGIGAPSIPKLRTLATVYKRPLAVFYLPEPPLDFAPLKDFRRLPGEVAGILTPTLAAQITAAQDRRQLALELFEELGEPAPSLPLTATLDDDPENIGAAMRALFKVSVTAQNAWRDERLAYNAWRERIESLGVLVFQTSKVSVKEARGFAIAAPTVPVIAVNGRDWYTARSFSLMHEFAHLLLGQSSISDYSDSTASQPRLPDADRIEVFCNAVAAATLLPRQAILNHPIVKAHHGHNWSSEHLANIARDFAVSEEAILRRLLTLGKTSRAFYQAKRTEYDALAQRLSEKKSKGGPAPHVAALARLGSAYARLVLQGYYNRRLTLSDLSEYLNLKVPHITKLESIAYGEAA